MELLILFRKKMTELSERMAALAQDEGLTMDVRARFGLMSIHASRAAEAARPGIPATDRGPEVDDELVSMTCTGIFQ